MSRSSEIELRVRVVGLILDGLPEAALKILSEYYGVREPRLRVGTVKRHREVLGCYVQRENRIYVSRSEFLTDPFVILHEFYHHLRASKVSRKRQVESRADLFALRFIQNFKDARAQNSRKASAK